MATPVVVSGGRAVALLPVGAAVTLARELRLPGPLSPR